VLWDEVGVARSIGCAVNFAGDVVAPGVRRRGTTNNSLSLGEPGGGGTVRLRAIAEALRAAGFDITTDIPIRYEVWSKLQRNVGTSTITVLTSLTSGAAAGSTELRGPFRNAMLEVAAIARAYGFEVECDVDAHLDRQSSSRHRPSMLQDLDHGRSMEIDAQFTVPLELARAAGVKTPTLDVLIGLTRARAQQAGLYAG
jgi:2-dehydropantoate 2-reductase